MVGADLAHFRKGCLLFHNGHHNTNQWPNGFPQSERLVLVSRRVDQSHEHAIFPQSLGGRAKELLNVAIIETQCGS